MEHDTLGTPSQEGPTAGWQPTAIVLDKMPQQAEVRVPGDDWTGRTGAAERRKLQNRLHQRTYSKFCPTIACASPCLVSVTVIDIEMLMSCRKTSEAIENARGSPRPMELERRRKFGGR